MWTKAIATFHSNLISPLPNLTFPTCFDFWRYIRHSNLDHRWPTAHPFAFSEPFPTKTSRSNAWKKAERIYIFLFSLFNFSKYLLFLHNATRVGRSPCKVDTHRNTTHATFEERVIETHRTTASPINFFLTLDSSSLHLHLITHLILIDTSCET